MPIHIENKPGKCSATYHPHEYGRDNPFAFLCCDLPAGHAGAVHHDPRDGGWRTVRYGQSYP